MALTGLVNLEENLLIQKVGQSQQLKVATSSRVVTSNGANAIPEDEFTLSVQNPAQAAVLYGVQQASLLLPSDVALPPPTILSEIATVEAHSATASIISGGTSANVEVALQSLNRNLAAQGLSNDNISAIDGIANSINNFDPATFTLLAHQLKTQQLPQQGTASVIASS